MRTSSICITQSMICSMLAVVWNYFNAYTRSHPCTTRLSRFDCLRSGPQNFLQYRSQRQERHVQSENRSCRGRSYCSRALHNAQNSKLGRCYCTAPHRCMPPIRQSGALNGYRDFQILKQRDSSFPEKALTASQTGHTDFYRSENEAVGTRP